MDIKLTSLGYLILLLVPMFLLNRRYEINKNKKIIIAILRMVIQLGLIGVLLQYLFNSDNKLLIILTAVFMILVAGISTINSTELSLKRYIAPVFLAFVVPNFIILLFFNTFVLRLDDILEAQYVIPIMGMILGNSLRGNIVCLNNFYLDINNNLKKYQYRLSLSCDRREAIKPYFKNAILGTINPTIASIETIGLVALPGMMTGQILGGSVPITAIKYQIAIMICILVARYFSGVLVIMFTEKIAFDDYDSLNL